MEAPLAKQVVAEWAREMAQGSGSLDDEDTLTRTDSAPASATLPAGACGPGAPPGLGRQVVSFSEGTTPSELRSRSREMGGSFGRAQAAAAAAAATAAAAVAAAGPRIEAWPLAEGVKDDAAAAAAVGSVSSMGSQAQRARGNLYPLDEAGEASEAGSGHGTAGLHASSSQRDAHGRSLQAAAPRTIPPRSGNGSGPHSLPSTSPSTTSGRSYLSALFSGSSASRMRSTNSGGNGSAADHGPGAHAAPSVSSQPPLMSMDADSIAEEGLSGQAGGAPSAPPLKRECPAFVWEDVKKAAVRVEVHRTGTCLLCGWVWGGIG